MAGWQLQLALLGAPFTLNVALPSLTHLVLTLDQLDLQPSLGAAFPSIDYQANRFSCWCSANTCGPVLTPI